MLLPKILLIEGSCPVLVGILLVGIELVAVPVPAHESVEVPRIEGMIREENELAENRKKPDEVLRPSSGSSSTKSLRNEEQS